MREPRASPPSLLPESMINPDTRTADCGDAEAVEKGRQDIVLQLLGKSTYSVPDILNAAVENKDREMVEVLLDHVFPMEDVIPASKTAKSRGLQDIVICSSRVEARDLL